MSEVKNKKKKSSMIQVSIGVLAVILAILIIIMMEIVSDIQGTARIVNYTGLVRGETQRIIKLEVAGEQDDAMIQEVRSFIDGLRNGNMKLNLEKYKVLADQVGMQVPNTIRDSNHAEITRNHEKKLSLEFEEFEING